MALNPPTPPVAPGPAQAPVAASITPAEPPLSLRSGLRRLSTGLLVYAVNGLILAVLGLVAMVYVGNRVGSLADSTGERIETAIGTVEDTATVLKDAGATALSFANTLERTPPTVRQAAQTIEGVQVPDSNFVQNSDLATSTAMAAVWNRVRGGATTGGTAAPGAHGHNLVSTKVAGGATLSTSQLNEIVATTDLSFQVTFENSGDSTETGVRVTLTIQKSPEPIVRRQTVDLTEPGQQKTVTFSNIGNVPFVQRTSLQVEVNEVAGEKNLQNNTAEYPVIFSYPGSG